MRFLAVVNADHEQFRTVTGELIDAGGFAWCQPDLLAFRFGDIAPGIRFALCASSHTGRCTFVKLLARRRALVQVEIPTADVGFLMPVWDYWQSQFRHGGCCERAHCKPDAV